MDPLEVRIIDAIADVCEAVTSLPDHTLVKYHRPAAVFPEDCPLLCVWLVAKRAKPLTTNRYDRQITIGVSWQMEAVKRAKTLVENPDDTKKRLTVMTDIEQAITDEAVSGGWATGTNAACPEAYELWPASMDFITGTDVETGLVQGYSMGVLVNVVQEGNAS